MNTILEVSVCLQWL